MPTRPARLQQARLTGGAAQMPQTRMAVAVMRGKAANLLAGSGSSRRLEPQPLTSCRVGPWLGVAEGWRWGMSLMTQHGSSSCRLKPGDGVIRFLAVGDECRVAGQCLTRLDLGAAAVCVRAHVCAPACMQIRTCGVGQLHCLALVQMRGLAHILTSALTPCRGQI